MHLYKYRDLSLPGDKPFERLSDILRNNRFWCAAPSTLNDPTEFVWECDYEPTTETSRLLAEVLSRSNGRPLEVAMAQARATIDNRRLEALARPLFEEVIEQCRREVGLACFTTSSDNHVMWERYGGQGNGVCVEIEVPDELLHTHLHPVVYPPSKQLHVDQLLASFTAPVSQQTVFTVALLSKPVFWAPESEIRFVSRLQDVSVCITGSRISRLVLGSNLTMDMAARIEALVNSLPHELPISSHGAKGSTGSSLLFTDQTGDLTL